jgi:hypothetical protein
MTIYKINNREKYYEFFKELEQNGTMLFNGNNNHVKQFKFGFPKVERGEGQRVESLFSPFGAYLKGGIEYPVLAPVEGTISLDVYYGEARPLTFLELIKITFLPKFITHSDRRFHFVELSNIPEELKKYNIDEKIKTYTISESENKTIDHYIDQ